MCFSSSLLSWAWHKAHSKTWISRTLYITCQTYQSASTAHPFPPWMGSLAGQPTTELIRYRKFSTTASPLARLVYPFWVQIGLVPPPCGGSIPFYFSPRRGFH